MIVFRVFLLLSLLLPQVVFSKDEFSHFRAINVFSAVPQPSDDGPNKTGGFGDVAANFVGALELARRYPEKEIRFLVTSAFKRYEPLVPTANEIVKIMAAELDPARKGIPQYYKGVKVIFLDFDFYEILKDPKKYSKFIPEWIADSRREYELKIALARLVQIVPPADLNLNFSHFPGGAPVMRLNAPVAIGAEEHYGDSSMVNYVLPRGGSSTEGLFVEVSSGPRSMGFMMTGNDDTKQASEALIRDWSQKANFVLPSGQFRHAFAYTMDWRATQAYIHALAELKPQGPWVFFVRDFPELDFSVLPRNIQIVNFRAVPNDVMRTLIQDADMTPMLTGDISLGHGLSTVNPKKIILYEAPPWKVESAAHLRGTIARDSNLLPHDLRSMFLTTEALAKMSREDLKTVGYGIANVIGDKEKVHQIYTSIYNHRDRWDLLGNSLQLATNLLFPDAELPSTRRYLEASVHKVLPLLDGTKSSQQMIEIDEPGSGSICGAMASGTEGPH